MGNSKYTSIFFTSETNFSVSPNFLVSTVKIINMNIFFLRQTYFFPRRRKGEEGNGGAGEEGGGGGGGRQKG